MSDDAEPKKAEFQLNWQVGVILAITFLALAAPLFAVALFAKSLFPPKPVAPAAEVAVADTAALAGKLEHVAEATLGGERILLDEEKETTLALVTGDVPGRSQRLVALAEEAGGSVLEVPAETGRIFVVHVPASRRELLRRALLGENVDLASVPAEGERELLRVELKAP